MFLQNCAADLTSDQSIVIMAIFVGTKDQQRQPAPTYILKNLSEPQKNPGRIEKPLSGRKAGICMGWAEQSHPEVFALFLRFVKQLAALGCQVCLA